MPHINLWFHATFFSCIAARAKMLRRVRSWEDELVVRYVIGKDGRVKEVIIVQPPQRDIFVDGTVRAIRSWRFKPMIKDGERQEVVHELTVYYRLMEPTT